MFEGLFQPMHLLIIFGIALLVFGPKKLPELGKGIGEGIRGFKSAMKADEEKPASITTTVAEDQRATKGWIVGVGTEILFILMLGLLVLGPKQLHKLLGHVARAKSQFEEASRSFKSQLAVELDAAHHEGETHASHELAGTSEPSADPQFWNNESISSAGSAAEFHSAFHSELPRPGG
jgi:sec-independent protein translocase protein TatA